MFRRFLVLLCSSCLLLTSSSAVASIQTLELDNFSLGTASGQVFSTTIDSTTYTVQRTFSTIGSSGSFEPLNGNTFRLQDNWMELSYTLNSGHQFSTLMGSSFPTHDVTEFGIYAAAVNNDYTMEVYLDNVLSHTQTISTNTASVRSFETDGSFNQIRFRFIDATMLGSTANFLRVGGSSNPAMYMTGFSAIPEPSSMLLVAGVIGIGILRRRR